MFYPGPACCEEYPPIRQELGIKSQSNYLAMLSVRKGREKIKCTNVNDGKVTFPAEGLQQPSVMDGLFIYTELLRCSIPWNARGRTNKIHHRPNMAARSAAAELQHLSLTNRTERRRRTRPCGHTGVCTTVPGQPGVHLESADSFWIF